jgi:hypothetical protein
MKLGELLQMLEGYNPNTEMYIVDQNIHDGQNIYRAITGIAVVDWGRRIDIHTAVKPLEPEENE